jgi:hypothetical protein
MYFFVFIEYLFAQPAALAANWFFGVLYLYTEYLPFRSLLCLADVGPKTTEAFFDGGQLYTLGQSTVAMLRPYHVLLLQQHPLDRKRWKSCYQLMSSPSISNGNSKQGTEWRAATISRNANNHEARKKMSKTWQTRQNWEKRNDCRLIYSSNSRQHRIREASKAGRAFSRQLSG